MTYLLKVVFCSPGMKSIGVGRCRIVWIQVCRQVCRMGGSLTWTYNKTEDRVVLDTSGEAGENAAMLLFPLIEELELRICI